jgi:hypothetical protein
MRNRPLHDSLRVFALDAARVLSAEIDAGAEVGFELDERSTGRSVLYRYRPLIAGFISERWQQLRILGSFGPAAEELGSGSSAYLRVQGLAADADPEPALLAMLERIWEDATSFGFPEDRFERVYADVERALYEGVLQSAIAAPLPGLVMERDRVDMGDGLVLVRGDLSGAPPEAVWPAGSAEIEMGHARPQVVAMIEAELPVDAQLPLPEARWRLRRLVTALRLWRGGSVALPATGWARADDGPWRQVALQAAPPARGGPWGLREEEEEGFRQFAALVSEWDPSGPLGWALARFDMGCERGSDAEALSDYLLALRGLLDAIDEAGQPTLGRRLAALCAEEVNRPLLQSRVESALVLELALIAGVPIDSWAPPPGVDSGRDLVDEIEDHLRALLRDVACGYLKPDLASTADEILGGVPADVEELETDDDVVRVHIESSVADWLPDWRLAPAPLAPPEGEPRVTRTADEERAPERQAPEQRAPEPRMPAPRVPEPKMPERKVTELRGPEQPSLVVDDFAWDVGSAEDYSAPA